MTPRKLAIEAVWQSIRHSDHVRGYFERVSSGDVEQEKVALVATVHYLIRTMQAMLRTGEVWRWDRRPAQAA